MAPKKTQKPTASKKAPKTKAEPKKVVDVETATRIANEDLAYSPYDSSPPDDNSWVYWLMGMLFFGVVVYAAFMYYHH